MCNVVCSRHLLTFKKRIIYLSNDTLNSYLHVFQKSLLSSALTCPCNYFNSFASLVNYLTTFHLLTFTPNMKKLLFILFIPLPSTFYFTTFSLPQREKKPISFTIYLYYLYWYYKLKLYFCLCISLYFCLCICYIISHIGHIFTNHLNFEITIPFLTFLYTTNISHYFCRILSFCLLKSHSLPFIQIEVAIFVMYIPFRITRFYMLQYLLPAYLKKSN